MTPLINKLELDAARAQPFAVIFFSVNWSNFAHQSRATVENAIALRQAKTSPERYFVVDVSEQCGELWDALQEWLQAVEMDNVLTSGSGPLLWLRSGSIVHQVIDPMNYYPAKISKITETVFQVNP